MRLSSEDAGTVTGIVSRGAETVGESGRQSLNSDDTGQWEPYQTTVTIPDGAGSVVLYACSVVDDAIVDDDQNVLITASAAGYAGGSDSLLVEDDEFPPVQIMDDGDAGFTDDRQLQGPQLVGQVPMKAITTTCGAVTVRPAGALPT